MSLFEILDLKTVEHTEYRLAVMKFKGIFRLFKINSKKLLYPFDFTNFESFIQLDSTRLNQILVTSRFEKIVHIGNKNLKIFFLFSIDIYGSPSVPVNPSDSKIVSKVR